MGDPFSKSWWPSWDSQALLGDRFGIPFADFKLVTPLAASNASVQRYGPLGFLGSLVLLDLNLCSPPKNDLLRVGLWIAKWILLNIVVFCRFVAIVIRCCWWAQSCACVLEWVGTINFQYEVPTRFTKGSASCPCVVAHLSEVSVWRSNHSPIVPPTVITRHLVGLFYWSVCRYTALRLLLFIDTVNSPHRHRLWHWRSKLLWVWFVFSTLGFMANIFEAFWGRIETGSVDCWRSALGLNGFAGNGRLPKKPDWILKRDSGSAQHLECFWHDFSVVVHVAVSPKHRLTVTTRAVNSFWMSAFAQKFHRLWQSTSYCCLNRRPFHIIVTGSECARIGFRKQEKQRTFLLHRTRFVHEFRISLVFRKRDC